MTIDKNMPCPVEIEKPLPSLSLPKRSMPYGDNFAMRDYIEKMKQHKKFILFFMGGFMLIALLVCILMTPVYEAKATLEVNASTPKVTKFAEFLSDPTKSDEFMQTQIELFQSVTLADRVIQNLKLANNPAFNPLSDEAKAQMGAISKVIAWVKRSIGAIKKQLIAKNTQDNNEDFSQLEEQTVLRTVFAENLIVTPKAGTSIINVAFDSSNAKLAKNITNELISEFIKLDLERKLDSTKIAKRQSEEQIRNVLSQLSQAEAEFSQFAEEAGIVSFDSKNNLVLQELEQINQSLAAAETDLVKKKERYEQDKNSDLRSLSSVIQNPLIQNLKNQYIDLMSEYEKLRVSFKDEYPEVQRIKAKMEDINKRINDEQNRILQSMLIDLHAVEKVARALGDRAKEKTEIALKLNTLAGKYKVLEHKVEMNKKIYLSLLERSKEIEANVGTDLGNIQVIDLASIPLLPSKPNLILYILVAGVLGLMSGTGLTFLREYLNDTVRTVDEISEQYWIPMLAVIPEVRQQDLMCPVEDNRGRVFSEFDEAIRFARVSIALSCSSGNPLKALLITSTAANEGKSTTSVHLAHSFAEAGERVLLIDVDLRKASRYSVSSSRISYEYGLTHYLKGEVKLDAIIHQTKLSNLYFVHSGYLKRHDPAELLNSREMRSLITDLLGRFDRIIFDGPPFGADAMVLSNLVDGVILITTLGRTHRSAMQIAQKSLKMSNGRLIGSIVNNVNFKMYPGAKYYQSQYSSEGSKADNYIIASDQVENENFELNDLRKIFQRYYKRFGK